MVDYLEELVFNYNQACQRSDGSIYGIEDGKQCRRGTPITLEPNDNLTILTEKAKRIGLSSDQIDSIKEKVKKELKVNTLRSKESLKLFAKKANSLVKSKEKKEKEEANQKLSTTVESNRRRKIDEKFEQDLTTGFVVPKTKGDYSLQEDLQGDKTLLSDSGNYGKVYQINSKPPRVIKEGKIGKHEAEAMAILEETGLVPSVYSVEYTGKKRSDSYGIFTGAKGYLSMSKVEGKVLSDTGDLSSGEREEIQRKLFSAKKVINLKGISHNDLHGGNVIVKEDGTLGVLDFGVSKIGYGYALIDAMGSLEDEAFKDLHRPVYGVFSPNSSVVSQMRENRIKALSYLKKQGIDWKNDFDVPKTTRVSDQVISSSPLANLTEQQIKEVLEIIYQGF